MRKLLWANALLSFSFLSALELPISERPPDDQLTAIFGSSYYVTYSVCDFAHHHGFRYLKILSYQFKGFGNTISGACKQVDPGPGKGRYIELKDDFLSVSFVCYDEPPDDPFVIDTEKYHALFLPPDTE